MESQATVAPHDYERDRALAEAVRRRDRKATAEFVQEYADPLYGYVLARVRPNLADAEDLTQEVFLAACRSMGDYRVESSLKTWLFGIARHKVEDYYRVKMREAALEEADSAAYDSVEIDSALDRKQLREQVLTILDRLPDRYRLLLKWRYWEQRRTDEIAAALERTPKAVERMLSRGPGAFPARMGGPGAMKSAEIGGLLASAVPPGEVTSQLAPAKMKSRIYSHLMQELAAEGPLLSLTETKVSGRNLCAWEELVRIAPVGEANKRRNCCRVCHARVVAERMEGAPIYWPHCPYAEFQNR